MRLSTGAFWSSEVWSKIEVGENERLFVCFPQINRRVVLKSLFFRITVLHEYWAIHDVTGTNLRKHNANAWKKTKKNNAFGWPLINMNWKNKIQQKYGYCFFFLKLNLLLSNNFNCKQRFPYKITCFKWLVYIFLYSLIQLRFHSYCFISNKTKIVQHLIPVCTFALRLPLIAECQNVTVQGTVMQII